MKKPQLSLALSVSVALAQASLLTAQAAPSASIWQKMSQAPAKSAVHAPVHATAKAKVATRTNKVSAPAAKNQHVALTPAANADGQAMLFLMGKNKQTGGSVAPAAALTIHPQVSQDAAAEVSTAGDTSEQNLVAVNNAAGELPQAAASAVAAKPLFTMLAPDRPSVAQGDVQVTPIPPVVTGTVDLEEFKSTNILDLKVSQSRTFKLKNKIVRTSISDPSIAEPVVVSENQIVLLGKAPGGATLVLWDDAGNSAAIDLRVSRDYNQLQATLREVDPRIIVKAFSVGGSDRVILLGDVDNAESIIRAFGAANIYMDDRGMNIQIANSRILSARPGETAIGASAVGGGQQGQLAQLSSVDRYVFFPNLNNNVARAQAITSDGGRVTSLVKVRKTPLIALHVSFMELNSTAARELATQLGIGVTSNTFAFGVGGNNSSGANIFGTLPFANQTTITGVNAIQTATTGTTIPTNYGWTMDNLAFVTSNSAAPSAPTGIGQAVPLTPSGLLQGANLFGIPGGSSFVAADQVNAFTALSNFAVGDRTRVSMNPTFQGVVGHSRSRLLAEPTLVSISGERSSFLAGGEIPILQSLAAAGAAQQSVVFEPFGVRLNCIPVLLESGSINLQVSPEVRLLNPALGISIPGVTSSVVPGFTTRKTQTIVEMKPGQELYIAGLLSSNNGRDITKTPIYGEIPVLGALYRSKAFSKNESELVIAIRPEIILPGTPGQLKLPEEIGRVEGPRDINMFQVEPTIIDERHYTTGRAERHQKTSPTLPEGAPIPDSN
ncbi:MAG: pilus assembly protein N-terminal domain-containing protein [Candidatus Obscuribacterales bacterium]|nr:pilus assembly protein N-terminal domain-containing protein [Candidatus Obscuribacterales bacterium]